MSRSLELLHQNFLRSNQADNLPSLGALPHLQRLVRFNLGNRARLPVRRVPRQAPLTLSLFLIAPSDYCSCTTTILQANHAENFPSLSAITPLQ